LNYEGDHLVASDRRRLSLRDPVSAVRTGRDRAHRREELNIRPVTWSRTLVFSPLAAVASAILVLNLGAIAFQLWSAAPKSPWDAGLTILAVRHLRGLPIYADAVSDQASTMYGPIDPILTSWLFHAFGVSNRAGKLLSLAASVGVVGMVLAATARRDLRTYLIAGALLFACNHNARFYFVEARPDMIAVLFALAALFLFAEWERRRRVAALVVSLAFFVLAFFTKQPLAAAALVPLCAQACRGGGMLRHRAAACMVAALPFAAVLVAIGCLRAVDPRAYFYMILFPAQFRVLPLRALQIAGGLVLLSSPMFLLALGLTTQSLRSDAQTRWWGAAVTVFFVAGVVAMAKEGGTWNSLLPFMIASAGFLTLLVPRALTLIDNPVLPVGQQVVVSGVLAVVLALFAFPRPADLRWDVVGVHGDRRYGHVVALARKLQGRLRCPEDPTIPLLARGEITRSAYFEMDWAHWPARLPAVVENDIVTARYVIQVRGGLPLLTDDRLKRLGFAPVNVDGLPPRGAYRLWTKAADSS
jgi:hypothetical protein